MATNPAPVVAALAVLPKVDKVLLVRRRNEPDADLWGFPGGRAEFGETIPACAVRELAEETGVVASAGPLLTHIDVIRRSGDGTTRFHFVLIAVRCDYVSGEAEAADDVAEVRWTGLDEIEAGSLAMSQHVAAIARLAIRDVPADVPHLLDLDRA